MRNCMSGRRRHNGRLLPPPPARLGTLAAKLRSRGCPNIVRPSDRRGVPKLLLARRPGPARSPPQRSLRLHRPRAVRPKLCDKQRDASSHHNRPMRESEPGRELIGTPSYDNWQAALKGEPELAAFEYLLLTDARLLSHMATGLGPYQFLNLVPADQRLGRVQPTAVLRATVYAEFATPSMKETDSKRYHGGFMLEEVAALASLILGVRLRCGPLTRTFDPAGDPRGTPTLLKLRPDPVLVLNPLSGLVLPSALNSPSLTLLEEMAFYPRIQPAEAIVLVRAARLYQDALWLAESEAHLAWLLLVSAVETAANSWRASMMSPLDAAKNWSPSLFRYLDTLPIPKLPGRVAEEVGPLVGSTRRFIDFLMRFLPEPPDKRPIEWCRIEWSLTFLREAFGTIYSYRSRALHDGMPFPAPMCYPPYRDDDGNYAEKPLGLAASLYGGSWLAKDVPMVLHTFEYIVRKSLLAWWRAMGGQVVAAT